MRTDIYDYHLPPDLIAQTPAEPRDSSRLLVVDRKTERIEHCVFTDLTSYLRPGDLLVANNSKVLPVRLFGKKAGTLGKVEVLLLRPLPQPGEEGDPATWEALVSPGRRVHDGGVIEFGEKGEVELRAEVTMRGELGSRILRFNTPPRPFLDQLGEMPLPPYIHERSADPGRYQTVYARTEGSAAAPTAGLHFTQRLIEELVSSGVGFATVVLHVGLDTFRPIHEEDASKHAMHREWYTLDSRAAEAINRTRAAGGRIIAVGTTSVRVLETVGAKQAILEREGYTSVLPDEGWSQLFITPGYKFALVDAMITNFHLPRTTLMMLVSAFAGYDLTMRAYNVAIQERYRFYSFGDAMLIL